jgi:hypothetical protein
MYQQYQDAMPVVHFWKKPDLTEDYDSIVCAEIANKPNYLDLFRHLKNI